VTSKEGREILEQFQRGEVNLEKVLHQFQAPATADLGYAKVDCHRALRKGFAEVIFGSGKTPAQVVGIATELLRREKHVLVTRITVEHFKALKKNFRFAKFHEAARCVTLEKDSHKTLREGSIMVLCAGTSDIPIAEEAAVTAEIMRNKVTRVYDVGVAGLQRLLERLPAIQEANVVIAVAGMEGALPSVVAGLIERPVIAVPTSIGYGANFGGLAALLGMLNSCGSGVTVVNIDNGFGAGYAASQMNALNDQSTP
jgi:NCAIR mutase (PurE)-related protein